MCRISLNINYYDREGNGVIDAESQYRKSNSNVWVPFDLDMNDPKTPDLFENGTYFLRIRLSNGLGWSEWFTATFYIGCGEYSDDYSDDYDT